MILYFRRYDKDFLLEEPLVFIAECSDLYQITKLSDNVYSLDEPVAVLEPVKTIELFQKPPSPKTFSTGDVIFQAGERGDVIYGIISGEIDILADGKVVETIHKGDIFGEGSLVHLNHQRDSKAIAKRESVLAFLDREHFMFAVQQTPMFALEVMKSYSNRLRRLRHILSGFD